MSKLTKLAQYHQYGVDVAFEHLEKLAADSETPEVTVESVEKVAADRAEASIQNIVVKTATDLFNGLIAYYNEKAVELEKSGSEDDKVAAAICEEVADEISKIAQAELENVPVSNELVSASAEPETEETEEAEEEPTEEEIAEAAVQGAAEVIADLAGKEPEDPDVQEAAVEVVEEAANAIEAEGEKAV